MLRRRLAFLFLLVLTAPALAAESDVKPELFADTTAIEAGKPFHLAVRLTSHPGWHIYWLNPGDAGLPTRITLHLPTGFAAGPIEYPLPQRIVMPGDIVNYGYEHPATFVVGITPTTPPAPGEKVTLRATISWLACKDVCVPGKKEVELELPVGTAALANANLFQAAQATLPEPACPPNVADAPQTTLAGNEVTCRIPWKQDVQNVQLFTPPLDNVDISDTHIATRERASVITFKTRPLSPVSPLPVSMNALIVFQDVAGKRRGFYTSIDLHTPVPGAGH